MKTDSLSENHGFDFFITVAHNQRGTIFFNRKNLKATRLYTLIALKIRISVLK